MRLALRALFPAALLAPSAAALTLGGGPPSLSLQDANSLLVTQPDTPVWLAPAVDAGRRGALDAGGRLRFFRVRRGEGCNGEWAEIGPLAWVCTSTLKPASEPPSAPAPPTVREGLPLDYYFVNAQGSLGYASLQDAGQVAPITRYEPGFALAMTEFSRQADGERYGRTQHGAWVPLRDLVPIGAPARLGVTLSDEGKAPAWVIAEHARLRQSPSRGARIAGTVPHHQRVEVSERREEGKTTWLRISDDGWLPDRDVAQWRPSPPPAELAEGEPWIDVDLEEQVVTAYAGAHPLYAAPASTGRGPEGSELATPRGLFRIWIKLRTSTMDNFEQLEARELYAIEAVPWVMFFDAGYGLHGAFWHNHFGEKRSHGCVNLTPADAQWFFEWTSPHLPAGWSAVLPTTYEPGTWVSIR